MGVTMPCSSHWPWGQVILLRHQTSRCHRPGASENGSHGQRRVHAGSPRAAEVLVMDLAEEGVPWAGKVMEGEGVEMCGVNGNSWNLAKQLVWLLDGWYWRTGVSMKWVRMWEQSRIGFGTSEVVHRRNSVAKPLCNSFVYTILNGYWNHHWCIQNAMVLSFFWHVPRSLGEWSHLQSLMSHIILASTSELPVLVNSWFMSYIVFIVLTNPLIACLVLVGPACFAFATVYCFEHVPTLCRFTFFVSLSSRPHCWCRVCPSCLDIFRSKAD